MNGNGDIQVLRWPGRVLSADDLRRGLNGHREVSVAAKTIVTPLAQEQLRSYGIRMTRYEPERQAPVTGSWGYAQQSPYPLVESAVTALAREGLSFVPLQGGRELAAFGRAVAECIASGQCRGGVIFSDDPALICCVANKVAGLRAAAIVCVAQAARAVLTLGANLLAVEMPGRTYFEIRQILRNVAARAVTCPDNVACTLKELDGHAHR